MQALLYRYTKTERKELLASLVVLVDTREQANLNIVDYFESKNIKYKNRKLDFGDYSFMLPENPAAGIHRPIFYDNELVIERKRNLNELSNNLSHDRTQFENELIRGYNSKFILMIEDPAGYENIIKHNYKTQYRPKSFIGTLHTFRHRYNIEINFIDPKYSGNFIYYSCYYWLREQLK